MSALHFKTFQKSLFLVVLLLVTIAFIWLIKSYLLAIFWAAVLAIVFYPLKLWFLKIFNKHQILSVVMTLLVLMVIVFVPLYLLGLAVVYESVGVYKAVVVEQRSLLDTFESVNQHIPVIEWLEGFGLDRYELREKVSQVAQSVGGYVASGVRAAGQQSLRFVLHFFLMLYVLFFLLKDGEVLLKKIQHLIPLGDKKEQRLFTRFTSTVRATMKGTIIIGLGQGILGALLFWLVGIDAPVIWGALMALLSIIPAVGSFIIWGPAAIILFALGSIWQAVVVLVVGAVVISNMDNVLRPILVGKDTQMPDVLVLLSTLGGLTVFGISGFVIGPVIAAFFLSLWQMFDEEYSKELRLSG